MLANEYLKKYTPAQRQTLKKLDCGEKKLTGTLDLSDFISLQELECWANQLTELILPNNLLKLNCGDNQLTKLNLPTELLELNCSDNELTEIDLPSGLLKLDCSWNELTELNLPNSLLNLDCSGNELTELDLPARLKELFCRNNNFVRLDLIGCQQLKILGCEENKLTELDLSHNTRITTLRCNSNQLAQLDLSHNPKLKELDCESNNLTQLILAPGVKIKYLNANNNLLNNWDFLATINSNSLQKLELNNNNLDYPELKYLGRFINLRIISIGNNNTYFEQAREKLLTRVKQGFYNRFTGNLDDLIHLQLKDLDISDLDIDQGIKALTKWFKRPGFYVNFHAYGEPKTGVKKLLKWYRDSLADGSLVFLPYCCCCDDDD